MTDITFNPPLFSLDNAFKDQKNVVHFILSKFSGFFNGVQRHLTAQKKEASPFPMAGC